MAEQVQAEKQATTAARPATGAAGGDLSKEIALSLERKPDERLRVVRLFGDCYRCNWWVQDPGPHPFWLSTGTIRKSRFIGCVEPMADRAAAQQRVAALRVAHPGAAHVCWALLAGGQSAAVDDGEPGGTAGRPMLNCLRSALTLREADMPSPVAPHSLRATS